MNKKILRASDLELHSSETSAFYLPKDLLDMDHLPLDLQCVFVGPEAKLIAAETLNACIQSGEIVP